jgi:pyrophosphate--fructose-6-phosphate 1-phosphotransferase
LAQRSREDDSFKLWNTRDDDLFNDIPAFFQEGLLMERDSHGNFPFSQVETEKVIMGLVKDYLDILKEEGVYKIGINKDYYRKNLVKAGYDPDRYGPILFKNYEEAEYLLVKPSIISLKTFRQTLDKAGLVTINEDIPAAIEKIFKKSVPSFKTQIHFYAKRFLRNRSQVSKPRFTFTDTTVVEMIRLVLIVYTPIILV